MTSESNPVGQRAAEPPTFRESFTAHVKEVDGWHMALENALATYVHLAEEDDWDDLRSALYGLEDACETLRRIVKDAEPNWEEADHA